MHLDYIILKFHQRPIRRIPVINHHFSCETAYCCVGQNLWKKEHFFPVSDLVTTGKQIDKKKLILSLKNTSKLWGTWSLALLVHNVLSYLHFFKVGEIILLKNGNLMLPAVHILNLQSVRLSNAASFCENYTKLFSDAKTHRCTFFKKVPFVANIECCPKFLEYALTRGIFR